MTQIQQTLTAAQAAVAVEAVDAVNKGGRHLNFAEVRQLRTAGLSYEQIGLYFGVNKARVWRFARDNGLLEVKADSILVEIVTRGDIEGDSDVRPLMMKLLFRAIADRYTPSDVNEVLLQTTAAMVSAYVEDDRELTGAFKAAGIDLAEVAISQRGFFQADAFFQFARGYHAIYREFGDSEERWNAMCKIYGGPLDVRTGKAVEILQLAEIVTRPGPRKHQWSPGGDGFKLIRGVTEFELENGLPGKTAAEVEAEAAAGRGELTDEVLAIIDEAVKPIDWPRTWEHHGYADAVRTVSSATGTGSPPS